MKTEEQNNTCNDCGKAFLHGVEVGIEKGKKQAAIQIFKDIEDARYGLPSDWHKLKVRYGLEDKQK